MLYIKLALFREVISMPWKAFNYAAWICGKIDPCIISLSSTSYVFRAQQLYKRAFNMYLQRNPQKIDRHLLFHSASRKHNTQCSARKTFIKYWSLPLWATGYFSDLWHKKKSFDRYPPAAIESMASFRDVRNWRNCYWNINTPFWGVTFHQLVQCVSLLLLWTPIKSLNVIVCSFDVTEMRGGTPLSLVFLYSLKMPYFLFFSS